GRIRTMPNELIARYLDIHIDPGKGVRYPRISVEPYEYIRAWVGRRPGGEGKAYVHLELSDHDVDSTIDILDTFELEPLGFRSQLYRLPGTHMRITADTGRADTPADFVVYLWGWRPTSTERLSPSALSDGVPHFELHAPPRMTILSQPRPARTKSASR